MTHWVKKISLCEDEFIKGFTLLELLVAISIIGILSSMVILNVNAARDKAMAAKLLIQLEEIERALNTHMLFTKKTGWPPCPGTPGCSSNQLSAYYLPNLIDGSPPNGFEGFDVFFKNAPIPPYGSSYGYDARSPMYTCANSDDIDNPAHETGVAIRLVHSGGEDGRLIKLARIIDESIDKGDGPNCGRIKWGGASVSVYYIIGRSLKDI